MNYLTFIAAVLNFGMGIFVWHSNPKRLANIGFAIIAFIIGSYVLLNFFFQIQPNEFLLQLILASGAFSVSSLFIWPYSLANDRLKSNFIIVITLLYLLAGFMSILSLSGDWFIKKVITPENVELGNYFYLYAIYLTILIISLLVYLYLIYKKANHEFRQRANYSILGFFVFICTILVVSVILPSLGNTSLAVLDSTCTLIFISFTGYAIVSKELFGIRVIITEAAVVIISITLFLFLITSQNTNDWALRSIIFSVSVYGGYLLIRSVQQEIKQKEELQRLSTQLELANSHLKELDKMKTEFVSLASHELLTPVSAIEGYLSMLLDEKIAKVEDPKANKYLDNVYKSSKRLARLVADMLNIARIEEGRLLVQKKDIDLSGLIKDAITEIKFKAEEHNQKIVFDNPDGWSTYGDPDKIKEVIINIIGNAIKYSKDPGTITIHVTKIPTQWVSEKWQKVEDEIKSRPLDDQEAIKSTVDSHFRDFIGSQQILIAIKDEGIGIPEEELPRLFKKFHRVGDYTTAESQGTGLGLYISRALVELHHGRIWADSEGTDKGSTFTFSLPDISSKDEILTLEAQVPQKEQLKPLARPVKEAEEL